MGQVAMANGVTPPVGSLAGNGCEVCGRPKSPRSDFWCSKRCKDTAYNRVHPVVRQTSLDFGQDLKAKGKALAADKNPELLAEFRRLARLIVAERGEVSIDDIRVRAELEGVRYVSGNWMGSVFNEAGWQFVRYVRAAHAKAHARPVGVWRRG